MTVEPRFRKGDIVDVVFRRAIVRHVNGRGTLQLIHSDEQMDYFDPDAVDVEITVVGHEDPENWT
jgi:hypothetical protein